MSQYVLIQNGTIIRENGEEKVDVLIEDGIITTIATQRHSDIATKANVIDATDKLLFPGLIDCHVHFREPGFEHKATQQSEGVAARSGGVTTVCEMPNTNPPTTTVTALADKVRRADEVKECDIRFFFGITEEEHLFTLRDLWTGESGEMIRLKQHCSGVKLFLDHSTGNQKVDGGIVDSIFATCAELSIPLVAHCEEPDINRAAAEQYDPNGPVAYHSKMRPAESEAASIAYAISMVRKHGTAFHVAHLSTAAGLTHVRNAKQEGLPVTCEVCPHHLLLTTDDYEHLGTLGKMNPPLRSSEDQDALWEGIADGTVDCVATDHAPHTLEEKQAKPPLSAPSGVPSVENMIPLLLTVAAGNWPHPTSKKPNDATLQYADIHRLCFTNPNRIYNLRKSPLKEGVSADIVIVDPSATRTLTNRDQKTKCGWTPFEGWQITGEVSDVL